MDLEMAKYDAALYYNLLIDAKKANLRYPVVKERKKTESKAKTTKGKGTTKKTSTKASEKESNKKSEEVVEETKDKD